jgi:thiol-disulfide isomerase/thioredoxin
MHITVVDSDSAQLLSDKLRSGNWIVLCYAEWCGYCQQFKPEWEHIKSIMPSHINTAQVESEKLSILPNKIEVAGYPTLKIYRNSTDMGDYQGPERTSEKILAHLNTIFKKSKAKKAKKVTKKRRVRAKMELATPEIVNEMIRESRKLKQLVSKTKILNPSKMTNPDATMKYLESTLRKR